MTKYVSPSHNVLMSLYLLQCASIYSLWQNRWWGIIIKRRRAKREHASLNNSNTLTTTFFSDFHNHIFPNTFNINDVDHLKSIQLSQKQEMTEICLKLTKSTNSCVVLSLQISFSQLDSLPSFKRVFKVHVNKVILLPLIETNFTGKTWDQGLKSDGKGQQLQALKWPLVEDSNSPGIQGRKKKWCCCKFATELKFHE